MNWEKKGVLPTVYSAVRAGECEQGKEEEHCSRIRVLELDKAVNWEGEGPIFQSS